MNWYVHPIAQSMIDPDCSKNRALLSRVAAAKGAVASTLARAVAALGGNPQNALPSLVPAERFDYRSAASETVMAGLDVNPEPLDAVFNTWESQPISAAVFMPRNPNPFSFDRHRRQT